MINGGYQPSTTSFDDSFTFTLYQETGTTETSYPVGAGAIFEGGASVRLWKGLALGGVISHFTVDSPATVTSSVPHPFFLQRPRQVTGEPEGIAPRGDRHPHSGAVSVPACSDGCTSSWPAARASSTSSRRSSSTSTMRKNSPTTPRRSRASTRSGRTGTATGFNAGVDFQWMFNPNLGVGALVRITKATVDLIVDNRTIQVDAGGTQIAAGIRLAF